MKLPEQNAPAGDQQEAGLYEKMQEMSQLLKLLALTDRQVAAGKVRPAREVFADLRQRLLSP